MTSLEHLKRRFWAASSARPPVVGDVGHHNRSLYRHRLGVVACDSLGSVAMRWRCTLLRSVATRWLSWLVVFSLHSADISRCRGDDGQPAMAVDLQVIEGRYLRLVTDLDVTDVIRDHVQSFDVAMAQWLRYWDTDPAVVSQWRLSGYLMEDRSLFKRRGLIPARFPEFTHGYQVGSTIWVMNQASDYYTRHLLLHEGVHALAARLFGGAGPPWYMEGTAEFLATHRGENERLETAIIPRSREASPFWGRIALIQSARDGAGLPSIEAVMRYGDVAHRDVQAYAWSWLASWLMEMYPEYRAEFRIAARRGSERSQQFNREYFETLRSKWPILAARWRLLCDEIDYGFDVDRHRVELDRDAPWLEGDGQALTTMTLATDRGWQSAAIRVRGGKSVEIRAQGRYVIQASEGSQAPWESEPDGVTITYHRGRPLGQLIGCWLPLVTGNQGGLPSLETFTVGTGGRVTAPCDAWLMLKINEPAGHLSDNHGKIDLQVQPIESIVPNE